MYNLTIKLKDCDILNFNFDYIAVKNIHDNENYPLEKVNEIMTDFIPCNSQLIFFSKNDSLRVKSDDIIYIYVEKV